MVNLTDLADVDISKFSFNAFFCLIAILGIFAPGFLFIFLYARNLFINLDFLRLAFLSIALSFPLTFFNCFMIDTKISNPGEGTDILKNLFVSLLMGSVISIFTAISLILLYYLTNLPIRSLRSGIWFLLLFNCGSLILFIVTQKIESKKTTKKP